MALAEAECMIQASNPVLILFSDLLDQYDLARAFVHMTFGQDRMAAADFSLSSSLPGYVAEP